jgi:hypothetical protein
MTKSCSNARGANGTMAEIGFWKPAVDPHDKDRFTETRQIGHRPIAISWLVDDTAKLTVMG